MRDADVHPSTTGALRRLAVQVHVRLSRGMVQYLHIAPGHFVPQCLDDGFFRGEATGKMQKEAFFALLAVGGLSGRLDHREITAVSPEGKKHDEQVLRVLQSRAWNDLLNLDPLLSARAQPVGGMHHLAVLSGFAQQAREVQVLSYQGIIGTGNAVVRCV